MKRLLNVLLIGGLFAVAQGTPSVRADETPTVSRSAPAPNAAVIYWQAFAAIPALSGDQQEKYDAATTATTAAFTDELKPILSRFMTALTEVHRARSVAPCDWQLDENAGPVLLLPHLQKARDLSRAGFRGVRVWRVPLVFWRNRHIKSSWRRSLFFVARYRH